MSVTVVVGVFAKVVVVGVVRAGAEATVVSAAIGVVVAGVSDVPELEHATATRARRATNVARITTRR